MYNTPPFLRAAWSNKKSRAAVNAGVSSAVPSPVAPKDKTLTILEKLSPARVAGDGDVSGCTTAANANEQEEHAPRTTAAASRTFAPQQRWNFMIGAIGRENTAARLAQFR